MSLTETEPRPPRIKEWLTLGVTALTSIGVSLFSLWVVFLPAIVGSELELGNRANLDFWPRSIAIGIVILVCLAECSLLVSAFARFRLWNAPIIPTGYLERALSLLALLAIAACFSAPGAIARPFVFRPPSCAAINTTRRANCCSFSRRRRRPCASASVGLPFPRNVNEED